MNGSAHQTRHLRTLRQTKDSSNPMSALGECEYRDSAPRACHFGCIARLLGFDSRREEGCSLCRSRVNSSTALLQTLNNNVAVRNVPSWLRVPAPEALIPLWMEGVSLMSLGAVPAEAGVGGLPDPFGGLVIESLRSSVGEALPNITAALLAAEVKEVVGAGMVVVKRSLEVAVNVLDLTT